MEQTTQEREILSLQNDLLQVRILPDFGGKISSIRSVRTGEEFLLPPLRRRRTIPATASFSEGDGGGFDECLPSVATCPSIAGEPPVPDHGDMWRLRWNIESRDPAIVLHADAVSRPLRLTRRASLAGSSLILQYQLRNLSHAPTNWLWSAHPLLRVEAGDRIVLPDDIQKVTVEYSAGGLFNRNSSIAWPLAQSTSGRVLDLSSVGRKDGVTAHKLFARMGNFGWGALYRHKPGQGLVLRFDPSALAFMGVWICSGAWPEKGSEKQYTVALEPTTSDTDSLASAKRNGSAGHLKPHGHWQWTMEIELIGASAAVNFEEFRANASLSASRLSPAAS
jgi:galactose mutarotase-like enzyme